MNAAGCASPPRVLSSAPQPVVLLTRRCRHTRATMPHGRSVCQQQQQQARPGAQAAQAAAAGPTTQATASSPSSTAAAAGPRVLQLEHVRAHLLRQEDSIIFGWVRRGSYPRNRESLLAVPPPAVTPLPPASADWQPHHSALTWYLEHTERVHALLGRYTAPDEVAFSRWGREQQQLQRHRQAVVAGDGVAHAAQMYPSALLSPLPAFADEVDFNMEVMAAYCGPVLDAVAQPGEDAHQLGSCLLLDVAALQALSKRVHYGKFVAEAKFTAERALFEPLIAAGDAAAVRAALTQPAQENAVAARVARKAAQMLANDAESVAGGDKSPRLTPEAVATLWRDVVMPLTKDVQVAYLMRRLQADGPQQQRARGHGHLGGFM